MAVAITADETECKIRSYFSYKYFSYKKQLMFGGEHHMFDGTHFMWGMHWAGWVIWILVIVGVVWLITRSQQDRSAPLASTSTRETPLEVLQRRYAEGEISTEEYEERKARLQEGSG
jgi:putative membrane protein